MPSSNPKIAGFAPPTAEDLVALERTIQKKLDAVERVIEGRERYADDDFAGIRISLPQPFRFLAEHLIVLGMSLLEHRDARRYFFADDKCVGCGTCERVCPQGRSRSAAAGRCGRKGSSATCATPASTSARRRRCRSAPPGT
ncbi:MAG TPA: hypothetical protein ENN53_02170 [Candidatus Acetothermia bacterium]|nr:hypothetical protein [Candidatus Acetothermia bacterium]